MYQQIAEDRVKVGVLFLDRVAPNWKDKVKLTSCYDLIDLRNDVFGGIVSLGALVNHDRKFLINSGLTLDHTDNFDEMFDAVNKAWRKALVNG